MKKLYALMLLMCINPTIWAQKKFTIEESEHQFLKTNLFLLAAKYDIDASKALTMQARIWDNPTFSAEINAYNPERKQFFDAGKAGQKVFGIEQLIYLGGKKRNEIKYAQSNEQLAELKFNDLLRSLKLQLRHSFYTVYFNNKSLESTEKQLTNLENLINAYTLQAQKGNIPLKDLVRLQSIYINFKNERAEVIKENFEEQANLKLLLNEEDLITPILSDSTLNKYIKAVPFDLKYLQTNAMANRPDFLATIKGIEANEINVKWQKSLAIPDVTLGATHDQRSGAFNNETNVSIAIPLPLWNKNKGNIKYAQTILEQAKVQKQYSEIQLQTEISSAWNKWDDARKNYLLLKPTVNADFELVYNGMLNNFQKRNISLLEFTDFIESYNQATIQINELKKKVILSAEELNNSINKDLF